MKKEELKNVSWKTNKSESESERKVKVKEKWKWGKGYEEPEECFLQIKLGKLQLSLVSNSVGTWREMWKWNISLKLKDELAFPHIQLRAMAIFCSSYFHDMVAGESLYKQKIVSKYFLLQRCPI